MGRGNRRYLENIPPTLEMVRANLPALAPPDILALFEDPLCYPDRKGKGGPS
jgi:hypothetical protein